MSNQMPIYSHVVPKSQYKKSSSKSKEQKGQLVGRVEFDPLNYNHGGNFQLMNPAESKNGGDKGGTERREARRVKEERQKRTQNARTEASEGKVEAYLRQNQANMQKQQHRHSAVRQAEHRVNLRCLPLNDVATSLGHDRTPDKHRNFEKDAAREHRRGRDRDLDDDEALVQAILSPITSHSHRREEKESHHRSVRKSSSSHRVTETSISTEKRKFFCREWAFQKIAHCLEQRPVSKTCGALILGDRGSGKTALCQELSEPGQGPQARQQRALNRRLLARHFLQGNSESSLRPGDFIRSIVMQILSHSSQHRQQKSTPVSAKETDSPFGKRDDHLLDFDIKYKMAADSCDKRFVDIPDDGEDSSKPLLDSEDQRTDEEDACARRGRTIDRIHERLDYVDSLCADAHLTSAELPLILPRSEPKTNNPFLTDNEDATRVYENHENLFLRNISQRQSKEIRSNRIQRQSSEPLSETKKTKNVQKSLSIDQKTDSASSENEKEAKDKKCEVSSSPPSAKVSRIPVANFRYPNKSELRSSSVENSPHKTKPSSDPEKEENPDPNVDLAEDNQELPEYQNVIKPKSLALNFDKSHENFIDFDEVPPPIPSLPISARTLIANAFYEKLLSDQDIQQALLPQNLEKNPDECFKKALLFPLLEIDPPKQCLFLLVDSIDEGSLTKEKVEVRNINISRTVAELLANHHHLFPQWLLLVCTARRHSKILTKMFTGFRKITIDELQRAHVSADVQRYVLARLDTESRLRSRVSSDSAQAAAAALDYLRIKSDGCMLYLEKVLDGVADGFIALREIKEIPGTLNGLYLWLAQRLFHGRRFTKVRLLLDVLLAARCGVTEDMLYKCLLTKEYSVTREDFNRRLHLLRRILIMEQSTGFLSIFHHSFASWLLDVKHCTRRYLCSPQDGHAALAMYYTLEAKRLSALEIHNYVLHMTQLEQHIAAQKKTKQIDSSQKSEPLNVHTLMLLWVLDSGCDIESALKKDSCTLMQLEEKVKDCIIEEPEYVMEGSDIVMKEEKPDDQTSGIDGIMPEFMAGIENARWPRDARVLRALLELSRVDTLSEDEKSKAGGDDTGVNEVTSTSQEEKKEDPSEEEKIDLDPASIHDIVARGDEDALELLLKHCPNSVQLVDGSGSTALSTAARAGRANLVRMLLQASVLDRWTPLRAAAAAGQTEVVEVLLEYGCDVDGVDADNRTALRTAAWSGHEAVVSQLLSAGANPDLPDGEGRTPLIAAAYMGHAEIVRALLDAGADVNHADEDGRTALSVSALCATGTQCAALLLERGADVSLADRDQYTPLLVAAFEGHTETCELLLENGASIEATCRSGRTALWAAASASRPQTLRLLLYWGANVDDVDSRGRTVLSSAAAAGNVEVVRQLLDRGLDEHHRDNSGWMPLHYAAFEGHIEVCEALLEAGAKVDEPDNDGKGALMLCAQEGHVKLIELLIDDWGAPVDQRAHDGKTALRLAALEGHLECVFALYERGADVDALDADRRSTLYVLALDNRLAMAKYLIRECNASVHTRDAEGRTPLHVSAWQGHTDMVNLLVKLGKAEIDSCDRCARTALHAAAWRGRAGVLRALLELGAARDPLCAQGATPLGIAAQEGHEDCVLYLLQYGADALQTDHCGRTPASVAWRAGHHNICRLLDSTQREDVRHLTPRSPSYKRRSVHSSNSTKSSSNLTGGSGISHDATAEVADATCERSTKANVSLSFAQQIARRGRSSRRDRDNDIPEHDVLEKEKLRSYSAGGASRDCASPLYASPPRSPPDHLGSPADGSQPPSLSSVPAAVTDQHFNRDTHMRIILGRDTKHTHDRNDSKNKRNGIVTNPAMRLVANVRNGLDNAAANIRRTGVALAASASSANPAVKTNAFQWRKETPL